MLYIVPMLRHADVWNAIDSLAKRKGMSPSGLAKRAGLDATTFNRSKRTTRDGKLRWPSTESVPTVLAATGTTLGEFLADIIRAKGNSLQRIPVIGHTQAGAPGLFHARPETRLVGKGGVRTCRSRRSPIT